MGEIPRPLTSTEKKLKRRALIKKVRFSGDEKFYKQCLRIKNKDGKLVPLTLNQAQRHIQAKCADQLARIGKVRKILLKGRQQGGSTFVAGRYYKKVTEKKGRTVFVLSHEAKTTSKLMAMVKRYHDNCPTSIKPKLGKDSASLGIDFPKLDSSYELGTAGNAQTGRGHTIFYLHGSEVAFWPNGEEILSGVLQAVPDADETEVVLESTANGVGGVFYQYVQDALAGEGEYELIFVPWYWQDEYHTRHMPPDFKRTKEEIAIAKMVSKHPDGSEYSFTLTDAQLMWRRNKIRELKSLDKFKQEYPFTIKEAFLFSGRPAFDVNYLIAAQARCSVPNAVYRVRLGSRELEPVNQAQFEVATEEQDGTEVQRGYKFKSISDYLQVWNEPSSEGEYAIAVDVAEGLEHGDYSSIDVASASGVQVAHWHGKIDPDELGVLVAIIGEHYNNAYVGVERNNHGLVTLKTLERNGYNNLHFEEELTKQDEEPKYKVGWYTSSVTKPLVIDQLNGELREENAGIQCLNTIEQCFTYEVDAKGRTNAREGCFDDCVMSYAILLEMVRRMPRRLIRRASKPVNKPKDWRT
jgi:hypothetical protein